MSRLSRWLRKARGTEKQPSANVPPREVHPWHGELARIKQLPRYSPFVTPVLGPPLQVVDSWSFYHSFQEIFVERLYEFACESQAPYIVDGGSNVGLSIIFFKQLYPAASIVGFEPDPQVYAALQQNIKSFGLAEVSLFERAVWTHETTMPFFQEGADAGRMSQPLEHGQSCSVRTVSLRDFLHRPVDMLKLDIEGAETEVLIDCAERLKDVRHIFVEYHSFADQPQRMDELLHVLREQGFRVQVITQFSSPQPFLKQALNLGMDLQLNVFAYRA